MPRIELSPIGAVIDPGPDLAATAAEVEAAGFPTIWLSGGPMQSLDQVTTAMTATRSARIGTSIVSVDRFDADAVRSLYSELEAAHPGRLVLGLGGAHGAKPLATLRAYLDALDGVPRESLILSALGPRMLELARDRASGAIPVLVTPDYTAQARAALGDDATLAIEQMVVLDTDTERARGLARQPLSFLSKNPGYAGNFERMGFTEDDVRDLSDRLVDGLIAWGDADAIAARVAEHRAAGADHVAVLPLADDLSQWRPLAASLLS
jgi:probable F420-dependent oxidoreductase